MWPAPIGARSVSEGPPVPVPWYASRYTGLFTRFGALPSRPHDPSVAIHAATLPPVGSRHEELAIGGAGWTAADAEAACVGEAIERWQPYPLPNDQAIEASYDAWPLAEPAVEPERWVLFHPEQYARTDFPFTPFTRRTVCRWVCCREAGSGDPHWVPEDLVYLFPRPGGKHGICPGLSTGLSAGRRNDPVLLHGLQEVIERDAVVGAWWGRYPLEECAAGEMFATLGPDVRSRASRSNLRYRCYRVASPFSAHVTIVTLEGEDKEGYCFSVGSACRETRRESWMKALLEAIHGRHYVRHLKAEPRGESHDHELPADFADHAVYYSVNPDKLAGTVLHRASRSIRDEDATRTEGIAELRERLGPSRHVLFRSMTPPGLAAELRDWQVLRVLVPGLQPLHGCHALAHLGGPLWARRGLADWAGMLPHPFP